MSITEVSETKWFGQGIYEVDGFVMVHSGRTLPTGDDPALRNEGVGIVMSSAVAMAWRNSGGCWRAVSSRIVCAQLKLEHHGGKRMGRNTYLSVVSVYAPTYNSPQEHKDVFYDDLCCTINSVSEDDTLIVLGDFNARVGAGSSEMERSQWDGVRGQHGVGKTNEAGTSLLTFCALNGLTVINTWFEKKDMYNKYTWQHPGNKK